MAIIKRDTVNPHKMEVVSPKQALEEALHQVRSGYEFPDPRATQLQINKLTEVVGALLNNLSHRGFLLDPEIVQILATHTLEYGRPVD